MMKARIAGQAYTISTGAELPVGEPAGYTSYTQRVTEFFNNSLNNELEFLLGPKQNDNRVARRRFKRLVESNWPLTVDPKRHPRLAIFVERAQKMLAKP